MGHLTNPIIMLLFSIILVAIGFIGTWVYPEVFILFLIVMLIFLFFYAILMYKEINKTIKNARKPFNPNAPSNPDNKQKDGIDNPSDRRDISDD